MRWYNLTGKKGRKKGRKEKNDSSLIFRQKKKGGEGPRWNCILHKQKSFPEHYGGHNSKL